MTAPPFIKSPRRAPADNAEAMEAGTEMTRAQGQPISKSASARYTHVSQAWANASGGTIATMRARPTTAGM